jgi:hypothetical protein
MWGPQACGLAPSLAPEPGMGSFAALGVHAALGAARREASWR